MEFTVNRSYPVWKFILSALVLYSLLMGVGYGWYIGSQQEQFGGDYITFWTRAHALWNGAEPQIIYDREPLYAVLRLPPGSETGKILTFPYPPHFLLALMPFSGAGYNLSVGLWLAGTYLFYLFSVFNSSMWRSFRAHHENAARVTSIYVMLSPFVLANMMTGQNGYLIAGLLIAGLDRLWRQPAIAGVCFGLLTMKPQLGMMLFVGLLAGRHWRCMIWAGLTAAVLAAGTSFWLGTGVWAEWISYNQLFLQMQQHMPHILSTLNISLYRTLVGNGLNDMLALGVQAFFFALATAGVWFAFSTKHTLPQEERIALLLLATFISVPHVLVYDMTVLIIPVLVLLGKVLRDHSQTRLQLALFGLVMTVMMAYLLRGWPLCFLFILFAFLVLLQQMRMATRRPS